MSTEINFYNDGATSFTVGSLFLLLETYSKYRDAYIASGVAQLTQLFKERSVEAEAFNANVDKMTRPRWFRPAKKWAMNDAEIATHLVDLHNLDRLFDRLIFSDTDSEPDSLMFYYTSEIRTLLTEFAVHGMIWFNSIDRIKTTVKRLLADGLGTSTIFVPTQTLQVVYKWIPEKNEEH